ncbi:hypothetical protein SY27_04020 [Flavobacterium sp. 316]|uniref:hypothetical protein n=1 Tax=Flavobacterium sp. 316 TaxID=1603293 RepID=UPI0005DBE9E4|nr:hypothetical protein [Flavobacterium sp. 316]KIX21858.1 hypothetical protein SY27_04020 [Flavobacterium sp. 316]
MTKKLLLLFLFLFLSCKETNQAPPVKEETRQVQSFYQEAPTITPDDIEEIDNEERRTYHIDNQYKYKYRTGKQDYYEYNYDIISKDSLGNEVRGNVNVRGKYGAGKITNTNGVEKDIYVQWIRYGVLKGTDEDKKEYEFVVE